jgi:transcriptional regulator with PAS, ATPase and Fis domain
MIKVLLMLNDSVQADKIKGQLDNLGYKHDSCEEATGVLSKISKVNYNIIICGMGVGADVKFFNELTVPFVMIEDSNNIKDLIMGLKNGAVDVIEDSATENKVKQIIEVNALDYIENSIVAEDESMKSIINSVTLIGAKKAPIVLLGESGVGKDVIANYIHDMSGRKGKFVAVNCAAIPDGMLESILFGYKKGSFTGAHKDHKGKFIESDGGTLFLDEIGDMGLEMQSKVLRAIESSSIDQIGGGIETAIDLNIIVATNRDIKKMVDESKFRLDLYYRLNIISFYIPPLRERPLDLIKLISVFLDYYSDIHGYRNKISTEAEKMLKEYNWPGNIRELKNVLHRATILSRGVVKSDSLGIELFSESLETVLIKNNGNRKLSADELGISIRTLQYRIKKEGLGRKCGT